MLSMFAKSGLMMLAATMTLPSAAPATAQEDGDIMYERYYYDDSARTIQVGYERDTCTRYGIGGSATQGRYGPYMDQYPLAICRNGQLYPL